MNKKKETNLCDAPTVIIPTINIEHDDKFYNCTDCSSLIEIISINEQNNLIEFKCLGKENHQRKVMSITEYLKKKNKFYQKNINQDLCEIHGKKNKYVTYCFDCNCHLCKECLKTRIHINHRKNNILEIQPTLEELNAIKEVIEDYKIRIENIHKENYNKIKDLEKVLNDEIINETKNIEEKLKLNKVIEENELELNKKKYINDLEDIKKKFVNEIIQRKSKFINDAVEIQNKFKLINNKEYIMHIHKKNTLNKKFEEEVEKLKNDKRIESMHNMEIISEIVYNTYNIYNNNYYNAMNINNIILSFYKNEYIKKKKKKKNLKRK